MNSIIRSRIVRHISLIVFSILLALLFVTSFHQIASALSDIDQNNQVHDAINIDIPILSYHKLGPIALSEWFVANTEFAKQMDILNAYGYETITLDDFINYRNGIGTPPEKPVIITFDDGFQSDFLYARPILSDRNMQATFFIPTGYIALTEQDRMTNTWNTGEPVVYHMIWPEVIQMYNEGYSIESHTVTHPNLSTLVLTDPISANHEITQSKESIISNIPSDPVNFFAYPHGEGYNNLTITDFLSDDNYLAAVGFGPPNDGIANPATITSCWAIPRRHILREVSTTLNVADPWWFFMRRVDPDFPLPDIETQSFKSYDIDGYLRSDFYQGERVTTTISVLNSDSPVNAKSALTLKNNQEILYASHLLDPSEDISLLPLITEPINLSYNFTIPNTYSLGQVSYSIEISDEHYLLDYFSNPFTDAFQIHSFPISITTNATQIPLDGNNTFDLVFKAKSTKNATASYLSVSLSHGLRVVNSIPEQSWNYYPIGSIVSVKDCKTDCPVTTYELYEIYEPEFGIGEKTYILTIQSINGFEPSQWIKYRLSMHLTEGNYTSNWFLRDPFTGDVDQQRYYANNIDVFINRNDIYLPVISKEGN